MNLFDPKNNFEWRDYGRILKRRKWYFILPFFLILLLGVTKMTVLTQPLYESSSTLQIIPSRLLSSGLRRVVPGVIGREQVESLRKRTKSVEYLTQLIYRLELQKAEKVRDKAREMQAAYIDKSTEEIIEFLLIKKLREVIRIKIYGSDVIEIKASALTPELAFLIVKTLTDIFIDESLRGELSSIQNTLRFNDEQVAVFKEKLVQAEKKLEQYKRGLIFMKVEDRSLTDDSLRRIREAIIAIEITTREKKDYLNYLRGQVGANESGKGYPQTLVIQRMQDSVMRQIEQMAILMRRYAWNSAEVIKINRDINELRNRIREGMEAVYTMMYPNTDKGSLAAYLTRAITLYDLEILNKKKDVLTHILDRFKYSVSQNPSKEMALAKLEEVVRINRNIYNMFLEQNQGVQIEESMQRADATSRFKIIDPPLKPLEPINAGYRMILLMTIIFGTGMGTGAVYLRELIDKSIRTVQEAEEYFQVPVVSVIPYLGQAPAINYRRRAIMLSICFLLIIALIVLLLYYR